MHVLQGKQLYSQGNTCRSTVRKQACADGGGWLQNIVPVISSELILTPSFRFKSFEHQDKQLSLRFINESFSFRGVCHGCNRTVGQQQSPDSEGSQDTDVWCVRGGDGQIEDFR